MSYAASRRDGARSRPRLNRRDQFRRSLRFSSCLASPLALFYCNSRVFGDKVANEVDRLFVFSHATDAEMTDAKREMHGGGEGKGSAKMALASSASGRTRTARCIAR